MLERNKLFDSSFDRVNTTDKELSEKFKTILYQIDFRIISACIVIAILIGVFTANIFNPSRINKAETSTTNTTLSTQFTSSPSTLQNQKIKVYITGEVITPGVYEIEINSRLQDLIKIAGNTTTNADLPSCNLASFLSDGMKVLIPSKSQNNVSCSNQVQEVQSPNSVEGKAQMQTSSLVNLNTATQTQLETLPGVGPSYALAIIDFRTKNGGFKSISDLKKVKGIGDKKYSDLKDLVTI